MSKYQDIMKKIEVTDEMKSRILQNIEKELKTGETNTADSGAEGSEDASNKIRRFEFRKYVPMAAGLLVFVLSTFLILNVIPHHRTNESATTVPMADSESAVYESEAPMATETAAEAEMAEEAPAEAEFEAETPMEAEAEMAAETEMAAEAPAQTQTVTDVQNNTSIEGVKEESKNTDIGKPASESIDFDKTGGISNSTPPAIDSSEGASGKNVAAITENDDGVVAPSVNDVEPVSSAKPGFFRRIARFFKGIIKAIRDFFK
ncbi:MAG: hypothetical protein E7307_13275 [Butyrivibrio sp.]|nr:hypothetical protein [Butyrivibrio sp.]